MMTQRRLLAALAILASLGCEPPGDPAPAMGAVLVASEDLLVLAHPEGIVGVDARTGETRWTFTRRQPPSPLGRFPPPYLRCPPMLAANGALYLPYSDVLVVLDVDTGEERFWLEVMDPLVRIRPPNRVIPARPVCPLVAPDSGLIVATPAETGFRRLMKFDAAGERVWLTTIPDVGILVSVDVNRQSGDILLTTATHLINYSPAGDVNWLIARDELPDRLPPPEPN